MLQKKNRERERGSLQTILIEMWIHLQTYSIPKLTPSQNLLQPNYFHQRCKCVKNHLPVVGKYCSHPILVLDHNMILKPGYYSQNNEIALFRPKNYFFLCFLIIPGTRYKQQYFPYFLILKNTTIKWLNFTHFSTFFNFYKFSKKHSKTTIFHSFFNNAKNHYKMTKFHSFFNFFLISINFPKNTINYQNFIDFHTFFLIFINFL